MSGGPYYSDADTTLWHGDCVQVMRGMDDNSIHAVVTDPPAAISFMAREWDSDRGGREQWVKWFAEVMTEALRVTKPGGHAIVWALPRTAHWTACGLEDAGWIIRDRITHMFASGFPKSLDVSKAIDRVRDDRDAIVLVTSAMADAADARGVTRNVVDAHMGTSDMGGWWLTRLRHRCQCPTWDQWLALKALLGMPNDLDAEVWRLNGRKGTPGEAWQTAEVLAVDSRWNEPSGVVNVGQGDRVRVDRQIKAANTDAARTWNGWGTALKPAAEDWWIARKPLTGTVASNVMRWGTGAINVDATRVGTEPAFTTRKGGVSVGGILNDTDAERVTSGGAGRWPSNIVLTHSASCTDRCVDGCPVRELDQQSGFSRDGAAGGPSRGFQTQYVGGERKAGTDLPAAGYGGEGCASRFFPTFRYEAKAPTLERPSYAKDGAGKGDTATNIGAGMKIRACNLCGSRGKPAGGEHSDKPWPTCGHDNWSMVDMQPPMADRVAHPTTKPLDLMRWLCRLVCPPDGTILDPFAGSGTTLEAAILEGFHSVGIEQDPDYLPLIAERIRRGKAQGHQGDLFGGAA